MLKSMSIKGLADHSSTKHNSPHIKSDSMITTCIIHRKPYFPPKSAYILSQADCKYFKSLETTSTNSKLSNASFKDAE